jgi:hypothetical protein
MGCCHSRNDDGNEKYSEESKEEIKKSIKSDNVEEIKQHFTKGFRFHHRFIETSSCMSFLAYAIKIGSMNILKCKKLTVNDNALQDIVEGHLKTAFSVILTNEDLLQSLVDTYGTDHLCPLEVKYIFNLKIEWWSD